MSVKISEIQRQVLLSMFVGERLEAHYSMGRGTRFYVGRERTSEQTVESLRRRGLIEKGQWKRTGICMHVTPYGLTALGRSLVEK